MAIFKPKRVKLAMRKRLVMAGEHAYGDRGPVRVPKGRGRRVVMRHPVLGKILTP